MLLEIVLTVVVVAAMLLFVGVPLETIITLLAVIVICLLGVAMFLFALFFVITDVSLLLHRYVKADFVRVDDAGRWDHAVYQADGVEYMCRFPAESVGRRKIYQPGKKYGLLVTRFGKKNLAYDRHSIVIIVIGSLFSAGFMVFLTWGIRLLLAAL